MQTDTLCIDQKKKKKSIFSGFFAAAKNHPVSGVFLCISLPFYAGNIFVKVSKGHLKSLKSNAQLRRALFLVEGLF